MPGHTWWCQALCIRRSLLRAAVRCSCCVTAVPFCPCVAQMPVVAIMTTGGGMRSLTALYGSLRGLKKLNVLDCATYLTGLSGTTW